MNRTDGNRLVRLSILLMVLVGVVLALPSVSKPPAGGMNELTNARPLEAARLVPPDAFGKSSPADGATDLLPTSVQLVWQSSTPGSTYEYCYDTSDNNTCNSSWVSTGESNFAELSGLLDGVTFYWQVRAVNPDNTAETTEADGGVWWSFATRAKPGSFSKSSPADDSIDLSPISLSLRWGASSSATSYEYCFDTSNNNTCNTGWTNVGNSLVATISGLDENRTYYWQVRAINAVGSTEANAGAWWNFETTGEEEPEIFVDEYEPNNTIETAFQTSANATALCDITLWPTGDVDWFRWAGKKGVPYEVQTSDLDPGLDTEMRVYDPQGKLIEKNDDFEPNNLASQVVFTASQDGTYYAQIVNKSSADPANKTYCFEVNQIQGTATPTPLPTGTRVPGADICEYNGDFDSACLIGAGDTFDMNFVPIWGHDIDNDFYRIWVKPGLFYSCETFNLSSVNDTNMILYDQNQNGIGGNDDRAPGDFGSQVNFFATYTGWLYVLVGPVAPPEYALSFLYTYSIRCTETVATPTATPMPTLPPSSGFVPRPPTATPTAVPAPPTPDLTQTPIVALPTPTPTVDVQVMPLPTNTPAAAAAREVSFDLTVYYDANMNFTPELTEGVEDVGVAIYDNATNELLAFGYTNEAGTIRFSSLAIPGMIRISIPFLQYSQVVTGDSNIFIRVSPFLR